MTSRALAITSLAGVVALAACDRLPFLGGGSQDTTATPVATADSAPAAAADTSTVTVVTQPTPPPARRPVAAPAQRAAVVTSQVDEPWVPTDTGTVSPGMSRDAVVAAWGEPVAERIVGGWMYLYFRNGCEVTCGTFDVVFLDNGQVVDAIVRGMGHTYTGVSSSPPGREALPTAPVGISNS